MVSAVFVYADGKVGLRDLPGRVPLWRIPRRQSVSAMFARADEPVGAHYDEYVCRGAMLDGRPIYCADGWTVREAYVEWVQPHRADTEQGDREAQRQVAALVSETRNPVQLDRWLGDVTRHDKAAHDEAERLRRRGLRIVIACWSS